MKKITWLLFAGIFLFSSCTTKDGIEIRDAWIRPTVQDENGAVYFILHNYSNAEDELLGASSEIAQAVELHESMSMDGDVMAMEMNSSLRIDGGAEVTFEPGGYHIMLVGLNEEAKPGDSIEITLHFENTKISLSMSLCKSQAKGANNIEMIQLRELSSILCRQPG